MHLKHVKIFGFKTFADRTEFTLEGGLTAVVGSNGCGKSNIVDALLWGLGEGNARQLRAATGVDVIFNGSANRRPLSYAEVQITFDNEDGSLPAPTSEVTISRRLNRGGESEYRINRTACRLKDIHELLADSGLGRSGYAIVGQQEIDAALSASADERRSWVDEAAGVQRYRQRKVEAQRRLASAQQHLQRTRDILAELEAQREPLREQAEVARRWRETAGVLREIEVGLVRRDYLESARRLAEIEPKRDAAAAESESAKRSAAQAESNIGGLEGDLQRLEQKLEARRHEHQAAQTAIEKNRGEERLCRQRLESIVESKRDLQESKADIGKVLETAEAEAATAAHELAAEEASLAELKSAAGSHDAEAARLADELRKADQALAAARQQEAARVRFLAESENRKSRMAELERELAGIAADEPSLAEGIADASAQAELRQTALTAADASLAEAKTALKNFEAEVRNAGTELRDQLQAKGALLGRIQGIQASLDANEGLSQGAKAVLEAAKSGQIKGEYQAVGSALTIKPSLATAMEAALGAAVNDLIVSHERDAQEAIAWLKSNRKGRATFQPISLMRPPEIGRDLRQLSQEAGVLGIAAELVSFDERIRPVAESLLNRILVAETLDAALRIARGERRPFSRIVTLDGEVVHASGSVSGGQTASSGTGFVQRKSELQNLKAKLAESEARIKRLQELQQNSDDEQQRLQQSQSEASAASDEARGEWREAADFLASLEHEKKAVDREKQRLERELGELKSKAGDAPSAVDVAPIEQSRVEILERLAVKTAEGKSFKERLEELTERTFGARRRLEAAKRRIQHSKADDSKRADRLAHLDKETIQAGELAERLVRERSELEGTAAAIIERIEADAAMRSQLVSQISGLRETVAAARIRIESLTEALHKLELDRARQEAKKAAAAQRLIEEFDLSEDDIDDQVDLEPIPADAERLASQLKRELKAMGEVNLGAIEAFDRLTERWDELDGQLIDIEAGIADVEASISQLDAQTQERFAHTLTAVQVHFANLVKRLFGGGDGALVASDPQNLLDTGLEIEVTLPGKRRQPLALLSGGERSICAMAFLFALLEVKTSPLVVLDEVDAPMDGHNLDRCIELLKDFGRRSQVIVITHNPTTISAAPNWLGVTMREPGVSTLIPYRIGDAQGKSSASASSTAAANAAVSTGEAALT